MRRTWGLIGLLAVPLLGNGAPLPRFTQPNAIWNVDVSHAQLRTNSAAMMTHLAAFSPHGWGDDDSDFDFHIDFGMYVLHANASTPTRPIVALDPEILGDYYSPDCDAPGSPFPVPAIGVSRVPILPLTPVLWEVTTAICWSTTTRRTCCTNRTRRRQPTRPACIRYAVCAGT